MKMSDKDKITIKGQFWSAGDNVYLDYRDYEGNWKVLCLNEFMINNIPENHMIEIEITDLNEVK